MSYSDDAEYLLLEKSEEISKLRELNAELVVMLRRTSVWISPDLGVGPDRLLDDVLALIAKAEKLK